MRSDEVLHALASLNVTTGVGNGSSAPAFSWLDFPLNEAAFGGDRGGSGVNATSALAPPSARQSAALWLKLGERLVVECTVAPNMNLTCLIPSYDDPSAADAFEFGHVRTAFSYDGYHFADLNATLAMYRFNATITSGGVASQFGGDDVGVAVAVDGGEALPGVRVIRVQLGDTGNQIDVRVGDQLTRDGRATFTLTVPYADGGPLSPLVNLTCNATNGTTVTVAALTTTTCANLTQTCVPSSVTCPPETSVSCRHCTDQARYPCYRPPVGHNPVVPGRCLAPAGTWSAFETGDLPLDLSLVDGDVLRGPSLTLYDPATILTGLPSPLLIPSVKRAGDTRSTITVDGSGLNVKMSPTLKLEASSGTSTSIAGAATLRVPELLSDIGYKTAGNSPNLLSRTSRMQMLFTAAELAASKLEATDTVSAVQLRYWGDDDYAPRANLYNTRLRYRWVAAPDLECLRGGRFSARNLTDDLEGCLTGSRQSNLTTAMEARTLLYRDTSVFVFSGDDAEEYWLSLPLDRGLEQWDGARALLLDLSYQVKPSARAAKFYVHTPAIPGQTRVLLWNGRSGPDGGAAQSGVVQELDTMPFVRFQTSTVYLRFEDVAITSSDDQVTDTYSVDVSLDGGATYIANSVQQEAAFIQMSLELGGLDAASVGDAEQAGVRAVLNTTTYNQTGRVGRLSVSITAVEEGAGDAGDVDDGDGVSSRRLDSVVPLHHRRLASTSTTITFRLYSSPAQAVDVGDATAIETALTNATTLHADLEAALNTTLTSVGIVAGSTTTYDPSVSDFYTDPAFYVYPYSSIVLDGLNPASSAIATQTYITLSGSNFVDPRSFDIDRQYARWVLDTADGGFTEW